MFSIEQAPALTSPFAAGVVLRRQRVGNPHGTSFWAAGTHSPRETDLARRVLAAQLRRGDTDYRFLRQVHGDRVVYRGRDDTAVPVADAQWTDQAGLILVINVADCCPVVVVDEFSRTVGIAHSGWRGTAANIVGKLIGVLADAGGAARTGAPTGGLRVWIGPCADGDKYEVGGEFPDLFKQWSEALSPHPEVDGKYLLDVSRVIQRQVTDAGVPENRISVSSGGTIGDRRYHSFRRDRYAAGRMAAFVSVTGA